MVVPKSIEWEQVKLPENWILEEAIPPKKEESSDLESIIETNQGTVAISFARTRSRNSFSGRTMIFLGCLRLSLSYPISDGVGLSGLLRLTVSFGLNETLVKSSCNGWVTCSSDLWVPIELNLLIEFILSNDSMPDEDDLGMIGSETTNLPENEFLDLVLAKDIATVP
ncbi:hypothetical protein GH714_016050 [Hevea brasiliensis]|uniref:Uncharacterized protein n=1 Tax=Hevea brasiliensis TaxID=3981 RepID=A0A6A6MZT8_HEVBR|nr:hypothetical protein GH714_016050 [Hevea brasiliensis]